MGADYSFELISIETYAPQFIRDNKIFLGSVDSILIDHTFISLNYMSIVFLYIFITTVGILSWLGARTQRAGIHVSQYGIVAKLCEKMATSFPTVVKVPFFRALHLHWLRKRALFYFAFLLLAKLPVYLPDVPILTKSAWVLIVWEHSVQLCNFCHIFYLMCCL